MELQLRSDQIGEITEWLRSVEDLFEVSSRSNFWLLNRDLRRRKIEELTFFMTPTASSVCPTKSSSFCSISALACSLIISSSGFIPLVPPPDFFDFAASSPNLEFSTPRLALVANMMFVFSVVVHPAKNRCWICASCAKRASPTFSEASAYFSNAVARGSSAAEGEDWVRTWEPVRDARAIAWEKVFGWGLVLGGAIKAAPASAGEVAVDRRWTFSVMVRLRSEKDSRILGG